jgi:hypothetical protein
LLFHLLLLLLLCLLLLLLLLALSLLPPLLSVIRVGVFSQLPPASLLYLFPLFLFCLFLDGRGWRRWSPLH